MTKRTVWQALSATAIGLALMMAASQAPAGLPGGACCLCTCIGGPQVCIPGPNDEECDALCAQQFNGSGPCIADGFNSTCAQTAECAGLIPTAAAPLVGPTGLTAVALLLGGFGVWQAARRARREQ